MRKHHVFRPLSGLGLLCLFSVFVAVVPAVPDVQAQEDSCFGYCTKMNRAMLQKAMGFSASSASYSARCINILQEKARVGDAQAQADLGCYYGFAGRGGDDTRRAVELLRKAAEQGNADGQIMLGIIYMSGCEMLVSGSRGIYTVSGCPPKDVRRGMKLLHKAAEQGNADGQLILGILYSDGKEGLPKDERRAVEWFRKAAEQGDTTAQAMLGLCYFWGSGLPKDERRGVELLRKAAAQGNKGAKTALCKLGVECW